MRHFNRIIILFLSALVVLTGCEKDSIQEKKEPQKTEHKTVVKKQVPKQGKKSVETPAPTVKSTPAPTKDTTSNQTKTAEPKTTTTTTKPPAATTQKAAVITASVQVIGYQGKTILGATNVPIQQGDTALVATQRILKTKGIPISVRGSGAEAYVDGIGNEFSSDYGPMSGWLVFVNGKKIGNSAGAVMVKKGDKVLWKYTTDGN